jgi:hypothetical protein
MRNMIKDMKNLKGSIVEFEGVIYRVSNHKGGRVNLGNPFGTQVMKKGIAESAVNDAEQQWIDRYTSWDHVLISRDDRGIHKIASRQPWQLDCPSRNKV